MLFFPLLDGTCTSSAATVHSADSELVGREAVDTCYWMDLSPLTGQRCLVGISASGGKVNPMVSRLFSNLESLLGACALWSLFLGGNVRVAFSHSNKLGTSLSVFFSDY